MAIKCKLSKCKDSELILLSVEWNKLKCLIVYPDQLRCIDETMVVAVHALLVVMKLWWQAVTHTQAMEQVYSGH